jgi:hypothetical protein
LRQLYNDIVKSKAKPFYMTSPIKIRLFVSAIPIAVIDGASADQHSTIGRILKRRNHFRKTLDGIERQIIGIINPRSDWLSSTIVYLHRYGRGLLAKLRTDYVHEQQERYRTQLAHIDAALSAATGSERAKLLKQQDKLAEQAKEIGAFEGSVHHLADRNFSIDLDDGVKKNYEILPTSWRRYREEGTVWQTNRRIP